MHQNTGIVRSNRKADRVFGNNWDQDKIDLLAAGEYMLNSVDSTTRIIMVVAGVADRSPVVLEQRAEMLLCITMIGLAADSAPDMFSDHYYILDRIWNSHTVLLRYTLGR